MILALKTDAPVAEISFYDNSGTRLHHYTWPAERKLARDLLQMLTQLMATVGAEFSDLKGVIVFKGPGSFTGLRIGITVANTVAYAQSIPIVGEMGDYWITDGLGRL